MWGTHRSCVSQKNAGSYISHNSTQSVIIETVPACLSKYSRHNPDDIARTNKQMDVNV